MSTEPSPDERVRAALSHLLRAATVLDRTERPVPEAMKLHGGRGGSLMYGWPYVERGEAWPRCAHDLDMQFVLQIDGRDALHDTPFPGPSSYTNALRRFATS